MNIAESARIEQPWARALRLAWARTETTPIHDDLCAEMTKATLAVVKSDEAVR